MALADEVEVLGAFVRLLPLQFAHLLSKINHILAGNGTKVLYYKTHFDTYDNLLPIEMDRTRLKWVRDGNGVWHKPGYVENTELRCDQPVCRHV